MSYHLGIDTSNYTTSVAIYDDNSNTVMNCKKLLPVKSGEKGIRQSDAVFHHTVQLPLLIKDITKKFEGNISSIGVSVKPSNEEKSYMPCFLTGISVAQALSSVMNVPLYEFSHQDGHIAAALYSADKLELMCEEFFAFHISGGTSQALLVKPSDNYFNTEIISNSLDLKAGQAIDRVGVMLGLDFPCGPELERLALNSNMKIKSEKVFRRDGNFSLSGIENKCKAMYDKCDSSEDIAFYCINYIRSALEDTVNEIITKFGNKPLVFSGGVMSNSIIQNDFKNKFNAYFAEPQYSSDNACGIALLSSICNLGK